MVKYSGGTVSGNPVGPDLTIPSVPVPVTKPRLERLAKTEVQGKASVYLIRILYEGTSILGAGIKELLAALVVADGCPQQKVSEI